MGKAAKFRLFWDAGVCPAAAGVVAVAVQTYQFWLLYNGVVPPVAGLVPFVAELQSALSVTAGLLILSAAMRRPRLLRPAYLLAGTIVCCGVYVASLCIAPRFALAILVGMALRAATLPLGYCLAGIALSRSEHARIVSAAIPCAILIATCFARFAPAPPLRVAVLLDGAISLGSVALTWKAGGSVLADIAEGPTGEVNALASPRSFLSPNHQVFVLMCIFSVAMGFASTLRIDAFTPQESGLSVVILVCVVAWILLAPNGRGREDTLFAICALLVVAGFLITPFDGAGNGLANGLLYAGKLLFHALSWMALASLCSRNPMGSVMVLACGSVASGVGTLVGDCLAFACNVFLIQCPHAVLGITGCMVFGLFAYVLLGLRGFSFAETIFGVQPAAPPPEPISVPVSREDSFKRACEAIAKDGGLTDRERQIFIMLARGHNGCRVRDELTLSYNTVKTYVKRIYHKLDVHSQQELINLVEREML